MLADMHTHSRFSPDADQNTEIEAMTRRAEALGLCAITVTDHCDCNYWLPESEGDYPEYQQRDSMMFGSRDYALASIGAAYALKERYPVLRCGIELGQLMQAPEEARLVASDPRLDFVIGSLHMNAGKPDFYWIEYNKLDTSELYALLDSYFAEELETCKRGDFDVLGHLTYPMRYITGEFGIELDMRRYDDIIREIFGTLIDRGKGIEINTSGLRQKYGQPFPTLEYVKLYRSLGGEIITLGSDSHRLGDIGAGIRECAELASEAGFRFTALFSRRRPEFIRLP